MDASAETNENQPTPRMLAWAKNSAAYRLAKRMMTERELSDAIKRKARSKFDEISEAQVNALAEAALVFGRNMKALDDQNYAEIRANSAARSGRSKRAIAARWRGSIASQSRNSSCSAGVNPRSRRANQAAATAAIGSDGVGSAAALILPQGRPSRLR